jgi:class 3 adenylate cyclase
MFSDIAGYTAMMGRDEQKPYARLRSIASSCALVARFTGRVIADIGDAAAVSADCTTLQGILHSALIRIPHRGATAGRLSPRACGGIRPRSEVSCEITLQAYPAAFR